MDGLRKVPDNVPNRELLAGALNRPLTAVPDPFGTHESFGHHNNARLRAFLDRFGFDYEFLSATDCYRSGRFDDTLRLVLERYDAVMNIMLPTLGPERRQTYSPFLPLHPVTGHVMQVPVEERNPAAGTIVWRDPATGERFETLVTGGGAKLQWKPDWAMRWVALGVDYEMAGKDLIDSVKVSGAIARALGAEPPEGFNYELFLDEAGGKISKSKGNGLTIDEWLAYGTPESLSLFMYNKPREAKRLHFDVIPRHVDDYLTSLEKYPAQEGRMQLGNPVWHIHGGNPPPAELIPSGGEGPGTTLSFSMLLNLVAVANSEDPAVLWGFIRRYAPGVSPSTHPRLDRLVGHAVRYFRDFVRPAKAYRPATEAERTALRSCRRRCGARGLHGRRGAPGRGLRGGPPPLPRHHGQVEEPRRPARRVAGLVLHPLPDPAGPGPRPPLRLLRGPLRGGRDPALIAKALAGELIAEHAAFLEGRKAGRAA
jgi:lysyl-tRNA synthetase class 1